MKNSFVEHLLGKLPSDPAANFLGVISALDGIFSTIGQRLIHAHEADVPIRPGYCGSPKSR